MKKVLVAIIVVAAFLRLFQIGTIPPSLTWDEAAWGYNAYSLGLDAKDEFGKLFPITFIESFGDFKPPLYAYAAILPIKIFGLTEFATRLPSAIFGILSVVLTYFLVIELFTVRGSSYAKASADRPATFPFGVTPHLIGLISSFILAISPWHIMLSRAAFEANVASFFIIAGVWLFLRSIRTNPYLLVLSAISFVLSMYTFNSARIVVPILVTVLALSEYKMLLMMKRASLVAALFGLLLYIPLFIFLLTPQAKLRFNEVNIFTKTEVINRANQQIANDNNAAWSKIIHNRRLSYGVEYVRHYFDNLTPQFLFTKGDGNPKFSIQDVGQLYLWEIPFLALGILFLIRRKEGKWWLVPVWLFIGIIPAGFARETPHALRIESVLPTFQILTAIGVLSLLAIIPGKLKRVHVRSLFVIVLTFLVLGNMAYFLHNYKVHYSREFSGEWQYGYKDAVNFVSENQDNYDNIVVTQLLGRPYIYFLFYTHYPPEKFRAEAKIEREVLGFVHVKSFSKYIFADDLGKALDETKNNLYLSLPEEVPSGANIIKTFNLQNGSTSIVAFTL